MSLDNKKEGLDSQDDWFAESNQNSLEPDFEEIPNVTTSNNEEVEQIANDSDSDIGDMPSANAAGHDGGNKKKLQLAAIGLVGVTVILLGVGVSVAKYEQSREEERVLEAEAAAQEQKQLANSGMVDIAKDQANMIHEIPPPPSDLQDGQGQDGLVENSVAQPQTQPLIGSAPTPEPYTPITAYEPVPNSALTSSTPSYSLPAPTPEPQPLTPTMSASSDMFASAPTTIIEPPPPVKGSQGSVLVDVSGARRVTSINMDNSSGEQSRVGGNLRPTVLAGSAAGRRGDTSLVLLKGATIPCVLETRIDSTYQGFTSCRTSRDVYSTNGKTLVMERGTKVFGEQNVDLNQGQARVAILWTRAETPKGVTINLDSPATGQLGEMGVNAKVKTHFWKRFGNSIMLSLIQDAISAGTKRFEEKNSGGDNNTTIENTSSSVQNMAEQALSNSINIPPTAIINQGTVINISVARDIDFSSVYGVKRR